MISRCNSTLHAHFHLMNKKITCLFATPEQCNCIHILGESFYSVYLINSRIVNSAIKKKSFAENLIKISFYKLKCYSYNNVLSIAFENDCKCKLWIPHQSSPTVLTVHCPARIICHGKKSIPPSPSLLFSELM